jgi:hypothetical protein
MASPCVSVHVPLHDVSPVRQLHAPPVHVPPEPQSFEQLPQCEGSLARSRHMPLHSVRVLGHPLASGPTSIGATDASSPPSIGASDEIHARKHATLAGSRTLPSGMREPHAGSSFETLSMTNEASGSPATTS